MNRPGLHAVERTEQLLEASRQQDLLEARIFARTRDICIADGRMIQRLATAMDDTLWGRVSHPMVVQKFLILEHFEISVCA